MWEMGDRGWINGHRRGLYRRVYSGPKEGKTSPTPPTAPWVDASLSPLTRHTLRPEWVRDLRQGKRQRLPTQGLGTGTSPRVVSF